MKYGLMVLALLASVVVQARDYSYEIEKAQRSCEIQRGSIMRDRNGTPACSQLDQLYRLQREEQRNERQREWNRSQERIAATPQRVIHEQRVVVPNGQGSGYRWNAAEGAYCDHDQGGYAVNCYRY
jgi:hypothetical protein